MAAELVSAAVSSVAKSWFESMKREISYVFNYQSYVKDIKNQAEKLGDKRQRVEQDVEQAGRQGDEVYEDVRKWLIRVNDFTENLVKSVIENEAEAKKRCFKGLCPNLFKRYNVGKKAVQAAKEGAHLLERGEFPNVSYRPSLEKTEMMHFRGYEQFNSRMKIFQSVMEALNDSNVDMIGIYGMGGVGKTTLVKQVAQKVMEDKLFDKVIMAEVTQTPDLKIIQDKLARDLGLEFGQQESVIRRADQLRASLKKVKRVLIILDNIWRKFELDALGIPFRDVENERKDYQRRCTIILTSRNHDLLCNDMNSQKNFLIGVLSNEEAWQLFEKIVRDSAKQSDFQQIVKEIVARCKGLPVALNTIANALKNKSLPIWKNALDELRNSNPREIHGMDSYVYSSIKLSYNFLESDEEKSLFLLCGLYSAGDSVNVLDLMRYGFGLGLFKNIYSLETARNRVHTLIDSLKASCLLLDGDTEDWVKMHDIIHDVAVSIAKEKHMYSIQNVADLKEETIIKGSTAICITGRDIRELPERFECPQLKLFLVFIQHGRSFQIPELLFEGMKQLKVLDFSEFDFPSLPSSLGCLIKLETLCLDGCHLKDITIVGQLKELKILSCRSSTIKELPEEIGSLMRLQLLDLSNCRSLEVIAPNVISKLSQLEELYMDNSFNRWEKIKGERNASLVELKGLSKLSTLCIHIPDVETISQDLIIVELERYNINIGNVSSWSNKYETSRLMKFGEIEKSIILRNYRIKMLLKRSEDLYLDDLKGLENVTQELDDDEGFSQLKRLRVKNCSEILHIISLGGRVHCEIFPMLKSLSLFSLINLEKVCQGQLVDNQTFSNLRVIKIRNCVKLKQLFSFSMAKNLLRLSKLLVDTCESLKMIVVPNIEKPTTTIGFKEINAEQEDDEKVSFPSLEELHLSRLFTMENIWPNHFHGKSTCPNLTKLILYSCEHLKYVFSYSMVNSLVQLQHIDITSCDSLEVVFVNTTSMGLGIRDEGKLIEMVFPKLQFIRLSFLPKLTSFAVGIDSVEFPSLLELEFEICPNLRRFISTSMSEDNTQPLFEEKVRLPSLESLKIRRMDNLRQIWHHQLASDSLRKLGWLSISGCDTLISIFPPKVALPNLEMLHVSNCGGLRSLMTLSIAESMVKLTEMEIRYCQKIEEIMEVEEQVVAEKMEEDHLIVFRQLKYLDIYYLPRLTSFCLGNYAFEFPSLKRVLVQQCAKANMKTFPHTKTTQSASDDL